MSRPRRAHLLPLVGAGVLLAFPLVDANRADQTVVILALVLAVGAVAVNIMSGYAGYHSFGEAVPFGIGAYAVAIASEATETSPFLWLPLGALAAVAYAIFVGWLAVRGRGHTFVILTLVAMLLVQFAAIQWESLTGGPVGHPVPAPRWETDMVNLPFHYSLVLVLGLTLFLSSRLRRSKLGAGLVALREDEGKAETIGVPVRVYKVSGFCISAAVLGVVGGIYAYFVGFINPTDTFSILFAAQLLLSVLLGGKGTLYGPVIGAFILQSLDYFGNQTFGGGNVRLFIVGTLMVVVVMVLPEGILPALHRLGETLRARRRNGPGTEARRATGAQPPTEAQPAPEAQPATEAAAAPPVPTARAASRDAGAPPRVPALEVVDLAKSFGGIRAVHGCSLTVAEGSITSLIGPNGSGKTTVFNLISGIEAPDAGSIRLAGADLDGTAPWDRAHLGLGRTFQITRLFLELTVLENVAAPLHRFSWRGLAAPAVNGAEAARAKELLEFVGLWQHHGQRAAALSYGQRKLVELAQVLMLRPRLILLDEPTGGINPHMVDRMTALIRDLNARGTTFLIVEHNMPFVLDISDHVHVLAAGRCIRSGAPGVIARDSLVREAYLGGAALSPETGP